MSKLRISLASNSNYLPEIKTTLMKTKISKINENNDLLNIFTTLLIKLRF